MQRSRLFGFSFNNICASGSAVEHLLAKEGVAGSIPVSRFLRQKRQPFKGCLFSALRTTRDLVPVVRSPLRSGRRKTEVHWTSCAPSRAPYFMIVLLASLRSACGGVWGEGDARAYAGLACGGVVVGGDARAYAGLDCGGVVGVGVTPELTPGWIVVEWGVRVTPMLTHGWLVVGVAGGSGLLFGFF